LFSLQIALSTFNEIMDGHALGTQLNAKKLNLNEKI